MRESMSKPLRPLRAAKKAPKEATLRAVPKVEGAVVQRPFAKLAGTLAKKRALAGKPPKAGEAVQPAPVQDGDETDAQDAKDHQERLRFAQMMRGVKPLRDGTRRVPTSLEGLDDTPAPRTKAGRARATSPEDDLDRSARARLEAFVAEGIRFEVVDDGESLEGRRLDVDPRELRKLRQLRYALDGTIDLHGLDATEARTKLETFLRRRRLQGDRAVLVVHGKGKHSPRGYAVLRGEIAAWLSQGRAQRDVAAFASVQDRDGTAGSVCVLLSR